MQRQDPRPEVGAFFQYLKRPSMSALDLSRILKKTPGFLGPGAITVSRGEWVRLAIFGLNFESCSIALRSRF
jgi:hypothetical protein